MGRNQFVNTNFTKLITRISKPINKCALTRASYLVAGLDAVLLQFVVGGVGLGVTHHVLDLVLGQAAAEEEGKYGNCFRIAKVFSYFNELTNDGCPNPCREPVISIPAPE